MTTINRVTILGNLGKDPTHRATTNSNLVQFTIAQTERYKKGNDTIERTEWVNVKCWGSQAFADFLLKNLKKGTRVLVEGKFSTEKYEKDGRDVYSTFVLVSSVGSSVIPLSSGGGSSGGDGYRGDDESSRSAPSEQRKSAPSKPSDDFDDEIPF